MLSDKFEDGSRYWHKVFHSPVEKPDNQGGETKTGFSDTDHHFLSSPEAALADVNTGGDFEALYFFILLIIPLTHHKLYFLSITLPYQLTHHVWQTTFYECIGARAHHSVCGHRGASHRGRRSSESKVCLTFPKTHCIFAHNSLLKILETSPRAITSIEVVFTVL